MTMASGQDSSTPPDANPPQGKRKHIRYQPNRSSLPLRKSDEEWRLEANASSATTPLTSSSEQTLGSNQSQDMTTSTTMELVLKKRRLSPLPETGAHRSAPSEQEDSCVLDAHTNSECPSDTSREEFSISPCNSHQEDDLSAPPSSGNQAILGWLEQVQNRVAHCLEEGDLMMARAYLQEATPIAFRAAQEGMCTRSYVAEHFISRLAHTCYQLGDCEEAIDHYTSAVHQEREDGTCSMRLLKYLDSICRIYVEVRQYSYALCVFKEIYDLQIELLGPNSVEVGSTLCNMGLMHYMLEMYIPSLHFYQETLRINLNRLEEYKSHRLLSKDQVHLPSVPSLNKSVGDSLNAMGLLYFKLRRFDEAANAFSCALNIREQMMGLYHRDVTVLWYNLAMVRVEMGDPRRAIPLYEEGIRRERIAFGNDPYHPALSHTLQYLGEIYNQLGDIEDSLLCFQEALEIERRQALLQGTKEKKRTGKPDHWATVCRLLNVIGNIHLMQADIPATMRCFVEAARTSAMLLARGEQYIPLVVAGHMFCHMTRIHPSCASAA